MTGWSFIVSLWGSVSQVLHGVDMDWLLNRRWRKEMKCWYYKRWMSSLCLIDRQPLSELRLFCVIPNSERFSHHFIRWNVWESLSDSCLVVWIEKNGITIRWERFENERWSEYASFLLLLPSLHQINHPLLLAEDTALALYGSCVFQQLKALNSTIRLDYELTEKMLRSNGLLRKEFITSKLFTFERYLVRLTGSYDV